MARLALTMADQPRYQVALGDADGALVPGLRLVSLTFPEATLAAVRYVQIPRWKELGILATHVTLSVGTAELLATLGDEHFAAEALARAVEHATALQEELPYLCVPEATFSLTPVTAFPDWPWERRFNRVLQETLGVENSGIIRR